jgi:hypothetical protein
MAEIMELTDLNFDEPKEGSSNFGGGLELLMNDRVKDSSKSKSDIELDDLNRLENELNDLVDEDINYMETSAKSDIFKPSVSFNEEPTDINDNEKIHLGNDTFKTSSFRTKTFQG